MVCMANYHNAFDSVHMLVMHNLNHLHLSSMFIAIVSSLSQSQFAISIFSSFFYSAYTNHVTLHLRFNEALCTVWEELWMQCVRAQNCSARTIEHWNYLVRSVWRHWFTNDDRNDRWSDDYIVSLYRSISIVWPAFGYGFNLFIYCECSLANVDATPNMAIIVIVYVEISYDTMRFCLISCGFHCLASFEFFFFPISQIDTSTIK